MVSKRLCKEFESSPCTYSSDLQDINRPSTHEALFTKARSENIIFQSQSTFVSQILGTCVKKLPEHVITKKSQERPLFCLNFSLGRYFGAN